MKNPPAIENSKFYALSRNDLGPKRMYSPMVADAMTAFSPPALSLEVRAVWPAAAVPLGLGMLVIVVISILVLVPALWSDKIVDVVTERVVVLSVRLMLDLCPALPVDCVS